MVRGLHEVAAPLYPHINTTPSHVAAGEGNVLTEDSAAGIPTLRASDEQKRIIHQTSALSEEAV